MMSNNQVCVPSSAVEAGDEDTGDQVAPSIGDEVEVTLKGKVSRVEGGNVYFTPTEANGQPLGGHESEPMGEDSGDDDASMDDFMAQAKSDEAAGGGY